MRQDKKKKRKRLVELTQTKRAVENRDNWRIMVAKSPMVAQRHSWLKD